MMVVLEDRARRVVDDRRLGHAAIVALVGDAVAVAVLARAVRDVARVRDAVAVAVGLARIGHAVAVAVGLALVGHAVAVAVRARAVGDVAVVADAVPVAVRRRSKPRSASRSMSHCSSSASASPSPSRSIGFCCHAQWSSRIDPRVAVDVAGDDHLAEGREDGDAADVQVVVPGEGGDLAGVVDLAEPRGPGTSWRTPVRAGCERLTARTSSK